MNSRRLGRNGGFTATAHAHRDIAALHEVLAHIPAVR